MDLAEAAMPNRSIADAVGTTVPGDRTVLDTMLTGLVAGGHVLLTEDAGTETMPLANRFANALGLDCSRIQFTSDCSTADVVGANDLAEAVSSVEFAPGPLFANVVLVEGIDRVPQPTRSALLEALRERTVTVDDETHDLPDPFLVVASPSASEGAEPRSLPKSWADRFWLRGTVEHPDGRDRRDRSAESRPPSTVDPVSTSAELSRIRRLSERVTVGEALRRFVTDVGRETHAHPAVDSGVPPRGVRRLVVLLRGRAVSHGRGSVTAEDVRTVAPAALAHYLELTAQARNEEQTARTVVRSVLDGREIPAVDGTTT